LVLLDKFVGDVCQLEEQERDLVLVHLDLFVVETMEGVVLLASGLLLRLVNGLAIRIS